TAVPEMPNNLDAMACASIAVTCGRASSCPSKKSKTAKASPCVVPTNEPHRSSRLSNNQGRLYGAPYRSARTRMVKQLYKQFAANPSELTWLQVNRGDAWRMELHQRT